MPFKTRQVVQATGVNQKTLHYWDRTGLISPSVQSGHGRGSRKIYSFRDLVAVHAARRLRRAGYSGRILRNVIAHLRRRADVARTYLIADGTVVFETSERAVGPAVVGARREYVFVLDVLDLTADLRRRLRSAGIEDSETAA
jgi:DNA-binding transcriptional MerR regulator